MELFDVSRDFLSNKPEMKHLLTMSDLADTLKKTYTLNKQLQGTNKTLADVYLHL